MERLQKYISRCGFASRRKAEELIRQGRVFVNGKQAPAEGMLVSVDDTVVVDGNILRLPEELVYYLLYKPEGFLCTLSDPHAIHTIMELLPDSPRTFPVGRLDLDSSGLIICTNDGEFANRLAHPSFEHEKEYEVYAVWKKSAPARLQARKIISRLETGIMLDGKETAPAKVDIRKLDESGVLFRIVIHEGRNRQVRRMCDAIGLDVKVLKRIRIGHLEIQSMLPGEYIKLSNDDISVFL